MMTTLHLDQQSKPFMKFRPGQKVTFTVSGYVQSISAPRKDGPMATSPDSGDAPEKPTGSAEICIESISGVKAGAMDPNYDAADDGDGQDNEDQGDIESEIAQAKRNTPAKLAQDKAASKKSY